MASSSRSSLVAVVAEVAVLAVVAVVAVVTVDWDLVSVRGGAAEVEEAAALGCEKLSRTS